MGTQSKGGRPATGSLKWRRPAKGGDPHWHVRLTLADGSRPLVPLDPKIPHEDVARAKACAKAVSDDARVSGVVSGAVSETVSEYATRWCAWREGRLGLVASETIAQYSDAISSRALAPSTFAVAHATI